MLWWAQFLFSFLFFSFQKSHRWKADVFLMETACFHASPGRSTRILHADNHHGQTWTCLCWLRPKFRSSSQPQHSRWEKLMTSIASSFSLFVTQSVDCAELGLSTARLAQLRELFTQPKWKMERRCTSLEKKVSLSHIRPHQNILRKDSGKITHKTSNVTNVVHLDKGFCNYCFIKLMMGVVFSIYFCSDS